MEANAKTCLQHDWMAALPAYQAALRTALSGFLNSPRRSRPVLRRPTNLRNLARDVLGQVEKATRALLLLEAPASGPLSSLAACIPPLLKKDNVNDWDIAHTIAEGYRAADALFHNLPGYGLEGQEVAAPEPINTADYQREAASYLSPVVGLDRFAKRGLRQDLAGFFLHGSLATLDYVKDYSDFDTLMILSRQTVIEPERLVAFLGRYRRSLTFIYRFDPLQHHGHIVLTEIDLDYYPNSFFPLSILEYARSLGGAWGPLAVRCWDDRAEMRSEFQRVCDVFAGRAAADYRPRNPYDLKEFLSELMLLPALYCQCIGNPCYKKFSFERARRDFSDREWQVMEEATRVRSSWYYGRKSGGWRSWVGRCLGAPEVVKRAGLNRSSPVMAPAKSCLGPDYVEAAARLALAMRRRLEDREE
jgi:hypothetical protein